MPKSNGHWSGEKGNSLWYSDLDEVNKITGGEGIPFVKGRADFSKWSEGTLKFKAGELDGTGGDFSTIYKRIMEKSKGNIKTQKAAKRWLKEKGLTPHHYSKTKVILVPTALHGNIPHIGSASDLRGGH